MKKLLFVVLILVALLAGPARAATNQDFENEISRSIKKEREITIVYWFPAEYLDEDLKDSPYVSDEDRLRLVKVLKDYTLIAVVSGYYGRTTFRPRSREEIFDSLVVHANSELLQPMLTEDVSHEVLYFVEMLKPSIEGRLGEMGKGFQFYLYPNIMFNKRIVDPHEKGVVQVRLFDDEFEWKTPLVSVLPRRRDPKTGEAFPGTYNFNPYTGDKLPPTETPTPAPAATTAK